VKRSRTRPPLKVRMAHTGFGCHRCHTLTHERDFLQFRLAILRGMWSCTNVTTHLVQGTHITGKLAAICQRWLLRVKATRTHFFVSWSAKRPQVREGTPGPERERRNSFARRAFGILRNVAQNTVVGLSRQTAISRSHEAIDVCRCTFELFGSSYQGVALR